MHPFDFFLLYTFRAQTRQGKEGNGEKLCPKDGAEQPGRALEVQQNPVHHSDTDIPLPDGRIAEPIDIDNYEQHAEGTHKVHDFRQSPEIIFLWHNTEF